jgi:hypothetical protein
MVERAYAIQNHIRKNMPERQVQYRHGSSVHTFRIEGQPTHWLYVSRELIHDSEPVTLINFVNIYHIVETLNAATKSKWLFLSSEGLSEVDENFTKVN